MDSHKSIGVGLVGYGYAGRTFHAPLIGAVANLRLAAVCSSNAAKVRADWPAVAVGADAEWLLNSPDLSLVVIATPNDSHFDLARRALLAGKHVVVDKPFTVTLKEALELSNLARQLRRLLSVFHNRRWDADFLTLQALLRDGRLGDLSYLESRFERFRPLVRDRWRERAAVGGGLWFDLGPHLLDQALQLFGQPQSLRATLEVQRYGGTAIDYFRVLLNYPNLRVALHASMLGEDGGRRFLAHGSQGCYVKHDLDTQEAALKRGEGPDAADWGRDSRDGLLWLQHGGEISAEVLPTLRGDYAHYYRAIADALLGIGPNPVPVDEAVAVMRLLELAVDSDRRGQEMAC